MKIIRNTFPVYQGVAHGEVGDVVHWESYRRSFRLVRDSDGLGVFSREHRPKGIDDDRPVTGVIAQVKSRGWIFEIG